MRRSAKDMLTHLSTMVGKFQLLVKSAPNRIFLAAVFQVVTHSAYIAFTVDMYPGIRLYMSSKDLD